MSRGNDKNFERIFGGLCDKFHSVSVYNSDETKVYLYVNSNMKKGVWRYNQIHDLKKTIHDKRIVLVGGCFDIFHYGHLVFLQKARSEGDILIVALESDQFIKDIKKKQSIHNQKERAEILNTLEIVDGVIMLPYFTKNEQYLTLVKNLKPSVIAVTQGDKQLDNKRKQAAAVGAKVKVVSQLLSEFSSTRISTTL